MSAPTILFSSRVDAAKGWKETLAALTDVQTSDNDSEMRVPLRPPAQPRRTLDFVASAMNTREAALLDNLIWGNQPDPIGIPIWPDGTFLASSAAASATSLTLDTTYGGTVNREFAVGSYVALWTNPFLWEIKAISGITSPGTLAIAALVNAWAAGTIVLPLTVGTLRSALPRRRPAASIGDLSITVDCDAQFDTAMAAAATWSGTQIGGVDFWETIPDWPSPQATRFRRSMDRQDGETGPFAYYAPSYAPILTRDYRYYLANRAALAQFKGFLVNRNGRANGCVMPTWDADLSLAVAVLSTDAMLTIVSCGYSDYVFPSTTSRRTLALITGAGALTVATVTAAVDNGNGTETLTLAAAVGAAFPLGTLISFIVPARLDKDETSIEYKGQLIARVGMAFAETPNQESSILACHGVRLPTPTYPTVGTYLSCPISSLDGAVGAATVTEICVTNILNLQTATDYNVYMPVVCIGDPAGVGTATLQVGFQNSATSGCFDMVAAGSGDPFIEIMVAAIPYASLPPAGTSLFLYTEWYDSGAHYPTNNAVLQDASGTIYASYLSPPAVTVFGSGTDVNPVVGTFYGLGFGSISTQAEPQAQGIVIRAAALFVNPSGPVGLTGAAQYTIPSPSDTYVIDVWGFAGTLVGANGIVLTATVKGGGAGVTPPYSYI